MLGPSRERLDKIRRFYQDLGASMIPHFTWSWHSIELALDLILLGLFLGMGWTWGCRIASKIP
jgi:hypothetical protein